MTCNYERLSEQWAQRILTLSPELLQKKLPELQRQDQELILKHFGRTIALDLNTGLQRCLSDSRPLGLNSRFNVYTLLWYCKEHAVQSGRWLPFRDIRGASPFAPAFQKNTLEVFAATFDGHEDALRNAVIEMGGTAIGSNGYSLKAFDCIPMQLYFWDGDEEFPAQGNILFDQNAPEFIHVESLVSIASECITQLAYTAQLPLVSRTYGT